LKQRKLDNGDLKVLPSFRTFCPYFVHFSPLICYKIQTYLVTHKFPCSMEGDRQIPLANISAGS
jgi:hypothetical protein